MITEVGKVIKACNISRREYRDTILSCNPYKRYVEVEYESADKPMRKYKK